MSVDEAMRILSVPPKATRRQIDAAFTSLRWDYVRRSQYAPDADERDVAIVALAKVQEAYRVLCKGATPSRSKPPKASGGSSIPVASLGGTHSRRQGTTKSQRPESATTAATKKSPRAPRRAPQRATADNAPASVNEKLAACIICVAIFLIAVAMLISAAR